MDWKENLDETIRQYLNELLREVLKYRKAYSKANDVGKAQLWVALALIYRELSLIRAAINEIKESLNIDRKKLEETLKKY